MTTKRLLLTIGAVAGALGLIVVVVAGGILGIVLYGISNSEAAARAKEFLQSNEKLKQEIGEVKGFGRFVTGSISTTLDHGESTLNFKVEGERQTVNASVSLILVRGNTWRVTSASYENSAGQTINLLDPYDSKLPQCPTSFSLSYRVMGTEFRRRQAKACRTLGSYRTLGSLPVIQCSCPS